MSKHLAQWEKPEQLTADPVTLQRKGQEAQSKVRKYADALAKELGLNHHTSVIAGPIKDLQAIYGKAARHGHINKVCDVCRFRILFNNPKQIIRLREILMPGHNSAALNKTWKDRGVESIQVEDNFLRPKEHGYIGLHMSLKVKLRNGDHHTCEIQFMHERMQGTDKETHGKYEEIRRIKENPEGSNGTLSENQQRAIQLYIESNMTTYEADSLSLGLDKLREGYVTAKSRPAAGVLHHHQEELTLVQL